MGELFLQAHLGTCPVLTLLSAETVAKDFRRFLPPEAVDGVHLTWCFSSVNGTRLHFILVMLLLKDKVYQSLSDVHCGTAKGHKYSVDFCVYLGCGSCLI